MVTTKRDGVFSSVGWRGVSVACVGDLLFWSCSIYFSRFVNAQGGHGLGLGLLPGLPDYSRDDFDRVFHFVE